jgi:uncharacterized protein YigE (DUF2233 family)
MDTVVSHCVRSMRTLLFVFFWVACFAGTHLHAQWRISGQSENVALAGGATHVRRDVSGPADVELKLVFFDAAKCELRVIDQPQRSSAGSLGDAMRSGTFVAGCNAGYFNPEFAPLGLVVSNGTRTGSFQKSSLLGGVIQVRKGRPTLLWRDEYTEQKGITELVQAGPRLVNGGRPVAGLEATKRRARTFILTDTAGKWAIGICDRASLRELSDILATPALFPEMEVERALNLDGGSSTGLWFRQADGKESYSREFATVRNFLAVVPRK